MASEKRYIGKYQIIRQIAKGGMGAIYLAKHPTLNRKVILKKLTLRGSSEIKARFKREAEIMMDLKNDFIVNVYDHFKEGSYFYLVVEYIEGLSLDSVILRDGSLDSYDTALIAYDVARALLYIHSKGIIHRDIKPGNILISKSGQVKLTDFGIASLGDDDDIDNQSKMEMLGTPAYMSPEQIKNFSDIDVKSDIYSFSVVIYEMLTGLKPFMGELNSRFFNNIKKGRYYRIKKMNKEASSYLAKLSRKGMHRNRKRRFKDFDIVISKLKVFIKKNRDRISRKSLASLTEGSKTGLEFKKELAKRISDKSERIKKRKKLITNIFLFIFIILIIGISHILGLPYRFTGSNKFGGLILEIPGNINTKPDIEDIDIYKESGSELEKIKVPLLFKEQSDFYRSIPITLSVGQYRIMYRNNGQLICNSFFVDSYNSRVRNIIKIPLKKHRQNRLSTTFYFYDVVTGKDITGNADLYIRNNGKYKDINSFKLLSGDKYNLRVAVDGYFTDHYKIDTELTDKDYQLSSGLIPKPGKLKINSQNTAGNIYINDKKYYLEGGTRQSYHKSGSLVGEKEFVLNPGVYSIKIGHRSAKGLSVIVRSNKTLTLEYPLDWE